MDKHYLVIMTFCHNNSKDVIAVYHTREEAEKHISDVMEGYVLNGMGYYTVEEK